MSGHIPLRAAPQAAPELLAELTRLARAELGERFIGVEPMLAEAAQLIAAFFPAAGACLLSGQEHQAGAVRLSALLADLAELIDALLLDRAGSKEEGR